MADIPFRRPYLFNSYPLQICFMFILHFIGRGSTFFLIISCSPSGFVTLHFKSCYVILCALCCACVLLPFCLQLCSSHVLHLYVFVLFFCFALFFFFFHFFPAVCLLAIRTLRARCWVLLGGLKTFSIIRARYREKLQVVARQVSSTSARTTTPKHSLGTTHNGHVTPYYH